MAIKNDVIRFGPAGNSDSFYQQGYKSSVDMPRWLHGMGLTAYEYTCTHGVNIGEDTARAIGEEARKWDIVLSVHAPYYINLVTKDEDKRAKTKRHIMDSLKVARWMGAKRVVFHPGSCSQMDRRTALEIALDFLKEILEEARDFIEEGIHLCPETMGKVNQLGTVDEVLEMCLLHESLIPTLDFGHINAMGGGSIKSQEDYLCIINRVKEVLGEDRARYFHCHFSRIEYSAGGEKRHWTLKDTQYGPEFEPLAEVLASLDLKPIIICESRGTMAEDAVRLKEITLQKIHLFNAGIL
ncbi:deoxyribonuclease-4 [Caldicoprobacter guelmensis]|uniref:TIM barrel protein n=1 Tax=Caldicoprobacter guelmensis TaxID=1170224 RepID=UPI00195EFF2D|nr:TIM barrel protein [Caldicoprobacter guelmensis]MBM7581277.1 deoxyribonuclease-4 [Caldicoprobacter guelmensis]